MPRQARKKSKTGIYHIIMRGINRGIGEFALVIRQKADRVLEVKAESGQELDEVLS